MLCWQFSGCGVMHDVMWKSRSGRVLEWCWQMSQMKVWYLWMWLSSSLWLEKKFEHWSQLKVAGVLLASSHLRLWSFFLSLLSLASFNCSLHSSSSVIGFPCITTWWAVSWSSEGKASLHIIHSKLCSLFLCCNNSLGV